MIQSKLDSKFVAYLKLVGIFLPTRFVWRPFGSFLEIDRCRADGRIVTNSQSSLVAHEGHYLVQPTRISLFEMILIWTRVIR